MNDKLVEILAEPVTCEDGNSHYIDENNRRYLASIIKQKVAEEIKRELENNLAIERCDPDVMPYFTDYYWMPKDVWQDFWKRIGIAT